jgi:hypothetical protein
MTASTNRAVLVAALVLAWFGAFAAADAIGQGWGAAAPLAVAAIPMAVVYYVWGGRDIDFAALLTGTRADERQELIRTRARGGRCHRRAGAARCPAPGQLLVVLAGRSGRRHRLPGRAAQIRRPPGAR